MSKIGDNIRFMRKQNKMSQLQLGQKLGKSESTIQMWETGFRSPTMKSIQDISNIFQVDIDTLVYTDLSNKSKDEDINFSNIYKIDKIKLPLLGTVACGEPIYADEERESYIMVGTDIHADFCLQCKGDSMINARIHDGDIVFVKKQSIVDNGEIAVVIIDDEATLKRFYYYKEQNMVILKPENSKYEDIILTGEKLNTVRVIGKAIAFQSDIK